MIRSMALAVGLSLAATTAFAQTTPTTPAPVQGGGDEVTVTAIRPAQMRNFIRQLAEPGKEDTLAIWDGKVCPGVVGVQTRAAQALIDQIALRALSIGLDSGRPGCRANVLVIVTPDAQAFTPAFVDQNKRFFSYYDDNGNAMGQEALMAFANTPRPVRWWHVSQTVTDSGQVLGQTDATSNADGSFDNVQVARVATASRVRATTRQEFHRVIIVVDAAAIAGRPFPAVADYIAMVSLAQIKADAERTGADSILTLFDPAVTPAPTGWTDWDRAYLEGLYSGPAYARSVKQQENSIVRRVERATGLREDEPPAPTPPR